MMTEPKLSSLEIGERPFSIRRNLYGLLVEMRPREWVKNLLVFTGVIFSGSLTSGNNLWTSLLGFVFFCTASSGIYVFNDLCDRLQDREHPVKSMRPIASGAVDLNFARAMVVLLFAISIFGSLWLSYPFAGIICVYLAAFLAYSIKLKDTVILDVILIASGFVLRAIAGAVLIGVAVSEWLVICTSMVALLIGFGKRRHELVLLERSAGNHRPSLGEYSVDFLDAIMNICAGAAVVTYALYTCSTDTVTRVGSRGMLVTIPFVVYGVFRYLFLIHVGKKGGNPVQILFNDLPTIVNLALWILASGFVIYSQKALHGG